jgi:hypothetical protein
MENAYFAGIFRDSLSFLSFEYRPIKSISNALSPQDFAHKKYGVGGRVGVAQSASSVSPFMPILIPLDHLARRHP